MIRAQGARRKVETGVRPGSAPTRVERLDHLRGLLALSVMAYHYWSWGIGPVGADSMLGRIGIYAVSAFFVLSGTSLGMVYLGRMHTARDAAGFVVKRIFRIAPLLWLSVAWTLLLGKTTDPWVVWLNLSLSFGFVQPTAYLSTGAWSIGNELVFYAAFAILVPLAQRRRWILWTALVVSVAGGLLFAFVFLGPGSLRGQWWIYVMPANQAFLFFAGVMVAAAPPSGHRRWAAGLVLALAVFCLWPASGDRVELVHGWTRVALSLACIAGVAAIYHLQLEGGGRGAKALAFLGRSCYSIYLLHPLVAKSIVFWSGPEGYLLAIPVTLVVSWATFRWIEAPCMALGSRISAGLPGHGQTRQ